MEVLVIGSSNGESILLNCGGWICVIDSFSNDDSSPVIKYLNSKSIKKIDLLVITHPHADHYEGLHHFKKFKVEGFLAFNQLGSHLQKIIFNLWEDEAKKQTGIIKWLENERSKLTQFYDSVGFFKETCKEHFYTASRAPGSFLSTVVDGKNLEIKVVAPFSNIIENSTEVVKQKVAKKKVNINGLGFQNDVNMFSTCLEVAYGNRKVLLLADVDNLNLLEMVRSGLSLEYDLIKVSHHGSKEGNAKQFWDIIRTQKKPCTAVITNHSKHELPDSTIIKLIRRSTNATSGLMKVIPLDYSAPKGLLFDLVPDGPYAGSTFSG